MLSALFIMLKRGREVKTIPGNEIATGVTDEMCL